MFRGIPPTPAPVIKKISGSGTYPASEQQVFTFLEGAFFGNLFESADLAQSCKMDDNKKKCGPGRAYPKVKEREKLVLPYTNVHACYSFTQDADSQNGATGVAYLNSRLCALPGADCFFHPPRPCEGAKSAHCQWVGSEGVYRNCKNPSDPTKAFRPITTYLNEPCDLVDQGSADNQELCGKLRALPRGRRPSDKPSSSCGGCSRSCSAGGQLQLLAGAAILALILRRRRRRG
jgi:hypothetical protein